VDGVDLKDAAELSEDQLKEMGELVNVFLDFYEEGKRNREEREETDSEGDKGEKPKGQVYVPDIMQTYYTGDADLRNIMLGRKKGDEADHLYLVDNYPLLALRDGESELGMLNSLGHALNHWEREKVFHPWWERNKDRVEMNFDNGDFWRWKEKSYGQTKDRFFSDHERGNRKTIKILEGEYREYYYQRRWPQTEGVDWVLARNRLLERIEELKEKVPSGGNPKLTFI